MYYVNESSISIIKKKQENIKNAVAQSSSVMKRGEAREGGTGGRDTGELGEGVWYHLVMSKVAGDKYKALSNTE